jgi:hypothetical protein
MRTIDLENGTKVILPSDKPDELEKVRVIAANGNEKEELWGTVIAMTNGEILTLL